jgi:predicted metalloprotease with PDZ domain
MKPWIILAFGLATAAPARAQEAVRYLVRVDDPASRLVHVEAEIPSAGGQTLVSLPAWSPGHYEIQDYAHYVQSFAAQDAAGQSLRWEKVDKDTWRVASPAAGTVRLLYDVRADTVNLSGSLLKDDFGLLNFTNLFVYPEERYDFASTVRLLPAGWRIATELEDGGAPATFSADNYDELVDAPTFIGHFGIDSLQADGVWIRLAMYPADRIESEFGQQSLEALQKIADYLHDFFPGGAPYDRYTTLIYIEEGPLEWGGGLEHADSHLDILQAGLVTNPEAAPFLLSLLSHEYVHAWNVKRIRPAEMWPYDYDREQFTPLLWVSEGITDYYGDIVLARTGLWPAELLWQVFAGAIGNVAAVPEASVEDASLDTWIEPVYAPGNYYYDKGKLIGLLFDAMIRDATDGAQSLDDVMVRLYRDHYQQGRGFTTEDFLAYVGAYVGEDRTREFYRRHIDGREPLPYAEVLAPIGIAYRAETIAEPFVGVGLDVGPDGAIVVTEITPGSPAEEAGLQPGDVLLQVGDLPTTDIEWGAEFRRRYAASEGQPLAIRFRRDGDEERTATTTVKTRSRLDVQLEPMTDAPERAQRLREGLLAP